MRRRVCLSLLLLSTLLCVLAVPPARAAELDKSLHFGYALRSGAVAIDPAVVYVFCPASDTLILNPAYTEQTRQELGARVLASGNWSLPDGRVVVPQEAALMISTADNAREVAANLDMLGAVSEREVVIAEPSDTTCSVSLSGFKCKSVDCSGCTDGAKASGGAMSGCEHTGNAKDTCTQTGAIKTCSITYYEKSDCTGAVISTSTTNMNLCQ